MIATNVYPKVLLLTSSVFNRYTGGGITLTNLFEGWPKERIAVVHNDSVDPDHSVCRHYYRLTGSEIQWIWPLSLLHRYGKYLANSRTIDSAFDAVETSACREEEPGTINHIIRKGINALGGEGLRSTVCLTNELRNWIERFNPDVIYSFLGDLGYMRLTWKLSSLLRIPFVIHIMDDWPKTMYRGGVWGPYLRLCMKRELGSLMEHAAARLGICDQMRVAYEKRYGQPFLAFHNALNMRKWSQHSRSDWTLHGPLRLVYSGSIIPDAQLTSLCDVCKAVSNLHHAGMDIHFEIHSPRFYTDVYHDRLELSAAIEICPPPDEDNVAVLFSSADLLILPVNFDRKSIEYIRYSMPTKVPAYMVSGTPVLVYGPLETASVEYADMQKWGHVVSKRSISAIEDAIRELASDEKLRTALGQRAEELAIGRHDAAHVRPKFQKVLIDAATS